MTARNDYERVQERLMQEIPQLLDGRVEYFDTCLFAVLKAQVHNEHQYQYPINDLFSSRVLELLLQ